MTARQPRREVALRGVGGEPRVVELAQKDFATLRRIAETPLEIRHLGKDFSRLHGLGLVRHEFAQDRGGMPIALARLTPAGEEALAQEYAG